MIKKKLFINSNIIISQDKERIKALQEGLGGIRDLIMEKTYNIYLDKYYSSDKSMRLALANNNFIGVFPRYFF